MHSLKGALAGLTLSLILLASETLAHPTQGYEDSYGKAGFLGLCGVNDDSKNKWVASQALLPLKRTFLSRRSFPSFYSWLLNVGFLQRFFECAKGAFHEAYNAHGEKYTAECVCDAQKRVQE